MSLSGCVGWEVERGIAEEELKLERSSFPRYTSYVFHSLLYQVFSFSSEFYGVTSVPDPDPNHKIWISIVYSYEIC